MKVLITGGNGFLGSSIARQCIKNNKKVLIISRNSNNIQDILNSVIYLQYSDYNSYTAYLDRITQFCPDVIIHCAWDGGSNYTYVNSLNQIDKNILDGTALLRLMTILPKKPHFIGIGSFSEYGIINKKALESDTVNPITMYGLSKSIYKNISKLFCEQNSIQWSWIRPCYIYGLNDVKSRLIPSIITKLRKDQQIVLDNCDTIIDYLHIDDFCEGILCIIDSYANGIFNICSGNEYSIKYIIDILSSNIDHKNKLEFKNYNERVYTSKYICGDNTKLKNLGWYPKIDIVTGLQRVIKDSDI